MSKRKRIEHAATHKRANLLAWQQHILQVIRATVSHRPEETYIKLMEIRFLEGAAHFDYHNLALKMDDYGVDFYGKPRYADTWSVRDLTVSEQIAGWKRCDIAECFPSWGLREIAFFARCLDFTPLKSK
jgi:hypothetical protein